jgi:hypothetical protein
MQTFLAHDAMAAIEDIETWKNVLADHFQDVVAGRDHFQKSFPTEDRVTGPQWRQWEIDVAKEFSSFVVPALDWLVEERQLQVPVGRTTGQIVRHALSARKEVWVWFPGLHLLQRATGASRMENAWAVFTPLIQLKES